MIKDRTSGNYKSWLNRSNIFNGILILFILGMLFVPDVKATFMKVLMKVGLYQPTLPGPPVTNNVNTIASAASIQFADKNGKIVSMAELKGKVVFVNFWTTWCPPCLAEMPSIDELRRSFKDDRRIEFLMVDMDSDLVKSDKFMVKKDYDLDVYRPVSEIPKEFYTGTLPTTLVFDPDGQLIFRHEGAADYTNSKFVLFLKKNMK